MAECKNCKRNTTEFYDHLKINLCWRCFSTIERIANKKRYIKEFLNKIENEKIEIDHCKKELKKLREVPLSPRFTTEYNGYDGSMFFGSWGE